MRLFNTTTPKGLTISIFDLIFHYRYVPRGYFVCKMVQNCNALKSILRLCTSRSVSVKAKNSSCFSNNQANISHLSDIIFWLAFFPKRACGIHRSQIFQLFFCGFWNHFHLRGNLQIPFCIFFHFIYGSERIIGFQVKFLCLWIRT